MANVCIGTMIVKGSERRLKMVDDILMKRGERSLARSNFYFDSGEKGLRRYNFECAWSVYSCMCAGKHTYYGWGEDRSLTTLREISGDCKVNIEVFAEEEGIGFTEHYIFDRGCKVLAECEDME